MRRARVHLIENGADLLPSSQARQIKMHPHDAERATSDLNIGKNRAAWFNHGKVQNIMRQNFYASADQNGIAVMANRIWAGFKRYGDISGFVRDQREGKRALPTAKASVCFLQRNNIRVDFLQYVENTCGTAEAICSDAFSNIVAGNFQHSKLLPGRSRMAKAAKG